MIKIRENTDKSKSIESGKSEGVFSNKETKRELGDYEFGKALYNLVNLLLEVDLNETDI